MKSASSEQLRPQRDAGRFGVLLHRLDDVGDRSIDVDREALERNRPGDVAEVVEHALDDRPSPDRPCGVNVSRYSPSSHIFDDQLAAVADVLNRVREIVDQPGRDASEHRLAFLLPDVLLQLDEPVGHRVEGVAELVGSRRVR